MAWDVTTLDGTFESVEATLLTLKSCNLCSNVGLLDSDLVKVLLLDSLLLHSLPLLLQLKPQLLLLDFSKLSLNIVVVDITVHIGLQLLQELSLLSQLILTSSLTCSRGRNVILGRNVAGLQLLPQDIDLSLWIQARV